MQKKISAEPAGESGELDYAALTMKIKEFGRKLGFSAVGIAKAVVRRDAKQRLARWLDRGDHGRMDYMAKNVDLRLFPEKLFPEVHSVISVRLPYWPAGAVPEEYALTRPEIAYVSRYALGRDYHKVVRSRLRRLANEIRREIGVSQRGLPFVCRAFSDSAPVMEVEFACCSGIAWRGKHSLSVSREGSWHFLGELYTSLPLLPDPPAENHCGRCRRCVDACPTGAISESGEIDARLCISCLTIEWRGAIPVGLRRSFGRRIYGCDDCQLACPWNRFTKFGDAAFAVREGLDAARLVDIFAWSEAEFATRLSGSPIRRIGYESWLRNIAVALGNADETPKIRASLAARADHPSPLVREHARWALGELDKRRDDDIALSRGSS
ncbi:MAG: tRNA epoxyqueuosine(34) reductase QueG [Candidatus Accumulibacter sp.]|jgi:epoxyqueuosine reductase|nr:tRNA epoxyqueuosine(34) reductase QueG [Accumulibacter sp.]